MHVWATLVSEARKVLLLAETSIGWTGCVNQAAMQFNSLGYISEALRKQLLQL